MAGRGIAIKETARAAMRRVSIEADGTGRGAIEGGGVTTKGGNSMGGGEEAVERGRISESSGTADVTPTRRAGGLHLICGGRAGRGSGLARRARRPRVKDASHRILNGSVRPKAITRDGSRGSNILKETREVKVAIKTTNELNARDTQGGQAGSKGSD